VLKAPLSPNQPSNQLTNHCSYEKLSSLGNPNLLCKTLACILKDSVSEHMEEEGPVEMVNSGLRENDY